MMRTSMVSWPRAIVGPALLGWFLFSWPLLPSSALANPDDNGGDTLSVRRVLIPPERVPIEMQKVQQGVLVQLSRKDFEVQVQRARQSGLARQQPPRLVETRYRANLVAKTFLSGTAQWRVLNPLPVPGVLPLQPWNLALTKARMQKARFDSTEAILGELAGKTLGLLINQPGEQEAWLDWTARGDLRPNGLHFSLHMPPCEIASMELNLPAGQLVTPRDTFLVSGPYPADTPDRSIWRIDFAGRSQLDLEIRPLKTNRPGPPLVFAECTCKQVLEPDLVQAEYDFKLEVMHHSLREMRLVYDPSLRPYEVIIRGLEGWETQPGVKPTDSPQLIIRLREPFQGGPLQVRCLAPLVSGKAWTSPGLQCAEAILRRETLVLQIHPEVRLEHWQPGDFRFTVPVGSNLRKEKASSGWQVLTLVSGGLDSSSILKRPTADIRTGGCDFRLRQLSWWQVSPGQSTLTVQAALDVLRGRLFRLPILLPADWDVVSLSSTQSLRNWSVVRTDGRANLVIDFQEPLGEKAATIRLTVRLRPLGAIGQPAVGSEPRAPRALPFRDLTCPNARFRAGAFAISVDPVYQARVKSPDLATDNALEERDAPWGKQIPDFYFPYPVLTSPTSPSQAVNGILYLEPRQPRFAVRCASTVFVTGRQAAVAVQLTLRPEIGHPDHIDLFVSGPVSGHRSRRSRASEIASRLSVLAARSPLEAVCFLIQPKNDPVWIWRTGSRPGQEVECRRLWPAEVAWRLSALSAHSPVSALTTWAALPQGEWWRIFLPQPLGQPLRLDSTLDLLPDKQVPDRQPAGESGGRAGEQRWLVPVVSVPAADALGNEIAFDLPGMDQVRFLRATGLLNASGESPAGFVGLGQTLRYSEQPVSLAIAGRMAVGNQFVQEVIDGAQLTTWVEPEGRLLHSFRFWVRNWRQRTLPVRLPPHCCPVAAKTDGKWIALFQPALLVNQAVELPVVQGLGRHECEILYTTAAPVWKLWAHLEAPAPDLPIRPFAFRRVWRLPAEIVPFFAEDFQSQPGPVPGPLERVQEALEALFLAPFSKPEARGAPASPTGMGQRDSVAPAPLSIQAPGVDPIAGRLGTEWTEWEPHAGTDSAKPLLVIRKDVMPAFGLALTGLLLLLAWIVRKQSRRWRVSIHLTWLAVSGLGLLWLPGPMQPLAWWPALMAGLLLILWYLRALLVSSQQRNKLKMSLAAGLAGWVAMTMPGKAAAPSPSTVYLVPASSHASNEQTVLVAPELLDHLRALANRTMDRLRQPILLSARYHGRVTDHGADFEAVYRLHSFADGPAALTLVLGGVQLKEASVDGIPAHPVTLAPAKDLDTMGPPRDRYRVELKGQGAHRARIRFTVPVAAVGANRDLQFAIPELAQSRVILDLPPGARYLQAAGARGFQQVITTGGQVNAGDPKPLRLVADLGRVGTLRARWHQDANPPQPAVVNVREAYLWDLRVSGSSLFAVLEYTVQQGVLTALVIGLPDNTEVRSVETGQLPDADPDEDVPRPKWWGVSAKARQLRIEFQRPLARGIQVMLELVPRIPLGPKPKLTVPVPQGARSSAEKGQEPLLAYRVEGWQARLADNLLVSRLDDRRRFREFWQSAGMRDPGPQTNVFVFQRTPGGAPFLRLSLSLPGTISACVHDVTWQVGTRRADLMATAELASQDPSLVLVEWEIGNVVLADVQGPMVRSWSQFGSRVQVWLRSPLRRTSLQLTGWLPIAETKAQKSEPTKERAKPATHCHFQLEPLVVLSAESLTTFVHVRGRNGQKLTPVSLKNLLPQSNFPSPDRELAYVTKQTDYGGIFDIQSVTPETDVRTLTVAEIRNGNITFTALVDYRRRGGGPQTLKIRLRPWLSGNVRLETSETPPPRADRSDPNGQSWIVVLPPGNGWHHIKLTGTLAADSTGGVRMPNVRVEGAAHLDQWVAVRGGDLQLRGSRGLAPVSDVMHAVRSWPVQAKTMAQNGMVWKVASTDWRLQLSPRLAAGRAASIRIYLAEQTARVVDGRRWAHEATYWLFHKSGTDLTISLPSGAIAWAAAVDGLPVPSLKVQQGRVRLPLSRSPGVSTVRVRWVFGREHESLDRPNVEQPQCTEAANSVTLWTIQIPDGYRVDLSVPTQTAVSPASPQQQNIRRAQAQLELSAAIAETIQGSTNAMVAAQLLAAQKRFYGYLQRAERRLAQASGADADLQALKERNQQLAKRQGFEKIRLRAEEEASKKRLDPADVTGAGLDGSPGSVAEPSQDLWPERSTPLFWIGTGGAQAPRLQLATFQKHHHETAMIASAGLVLLLVAVWILACFPTIASWARILWPEQLALLGGLGWYFGHPGWPFLCLVFLGVLARLGYLGLWVFSILRAGLRT